jgi:hypothetical protein
VTEPSEPASPEAGAILQALARSSGHELRNALNGLVVNLEVIRAQTAAAHVSVEPFMAQAVAQSEESIRLAEASIALMILVAKSYPGDSVNKMKGRVRLEGGGEGERFEKALAPLVQRGVLSVETSGSAVILRIPEDSPE